MTSVESRGKVGWPFFTIFEKACPERSRTGRGSSFSYLKNSTTPEGAPFKLCLGGDFDVHERARNWGTPKVQVPEKWATRPGTNRVNGLCTSNCAIVTRFVRGTSVLFQKA
jgi:hypothetical protein